MALDFNVKVEGVEEVRAKLRKLPQNGRDEARKAMTKLSREMANKLRAAVRSKAYKRQGYLIAPTIRAQTGLSAGVLVGPHPVLFGTEFGANGRFGWYSAERYRESPGRQFKPHIGAAGYWFSPTVEHEQPLYDQAVQEIVDAVVRDWGS